MTRNEVLEAVDALEKCDSAVDEAQRKVLACKVRVAFMATEQAWEEQDTLLQDFRQALPENEQGPGLEQAVLTAIDTRREVLAAVDEHVPGWDPARPVAEVVGHLANEALNVGELEEGLSVANDEIASREVERDDLKARLAAAESARDGNARQVDALRAWKKDASASLRRLTAQLEALHGAARPFVALAAQENKIEAFRGKPSSYEVLHLCDDFGKYRAVTLGDCRSLVVAFAHAYPGPPPLASGSAAEHVSPAYGFAPTSAGRMLTKADAADAVFAIRPVLVTDRYTEGIAVACEEFAHRLGLDVGHGPPNAAGYGEARLQAHLARYRPTEPTSAVYAMGPDTVWTNGRIRVHRSGTVQIGPHWDAIQDGDLQALGAAMVRMRADMLTADPYVSRVTEFHRAMGLPVRVVPSVGTVAERILRVRLLLEEVLEYATASAVRVELAGFRIKGTGELTIGENVGATPDLVAMTHELGDVQVIVSGTAAQLGLPLLAAVSEEIHPANMRKLGPDGRPVLRADGKVVKPEGWKPANVARIVERVLAADEVTS